MLDDMSVHRGSMDQAVAEIWTTQVDAQTGHQSPTDSLERPDERTRAGTMRWNTAAPKPRGRRWRRQAAVSRRGSFQPGRMK
jgi:hypothetical protein